MGYGIDRGFGYTNSPEPITVCDIAEEVIRARDKFPSNRFLFLALIEELGEVARAVLQKKPEHEVRLEWIQVAAVVVRLLEEDDPTIHGQTDAEALP
jgi:cell division inhibitor SulA